MIKQRLIAAFQRNLGSSGGVLVNFPGFSLLVQVLEFQHFRISILQQVLREGACGQNVSFLGNEDEIQIPQPQLSPMAFLHSTKQSPWGVPCTYTFICEAPRFTSVSTANLHGLWWEGWPSLLHRSTCAQCLAHSRCWFNGFSRHLNQAFHSRIEERWSLIFH